MAIAGDGTNHIDGGTASWSLVSGGDFTFSAGGWIRFPNNPTSAKQTNCFGLPGSSQNQISFSWDHSSSSTQYSWVFRLSPSGFTILQYSSQPSLNTWHHILVTCDSASSTNNVEIYINGANDTPASNDVGDIKQTVNHLGYFSHDNGPSDAFDGDMAEWGLWDGAVLSALEVAALGNGMSPALVRRGSLSSYWPGVRQPLTQLMSTGGAFSEVGAGALTVTDHPPIINPPAQILQFPVAAAAGGLSIPVAMHNYRQRHQY